MKPKLTIYIILIAIIAFFAFSCASSSNSADSNYLPTTEDSDYDALAELEEENKEDDVVESTEEAPADIEVRIQEMCIVEDEAMELEEAPIDGGSNNTGISSGKIALERPATTVDDTEALNPYEEYNTEEYDYIDENPFMSVLQNPLSTFSVDVDTASYSNMRRYLIYGNRPPKDSIRIEEFINYFEYDYPEPTDEHPFSVTLEMSKCPWAEDHKLVHIGLKGKNIPEEDIPARNIVFLIDVSGSMSNEDKLPLLKQSFEMLLPSLDKDDRITIVVYAGAAGMVLPPTPGNESETIRNAFLNLSSGGSTAGGAGIELAYKMAKENFIKDGINRVILATDGDFNVGKSRSDLIRMIEEYRNTGIYLTTLGFGTGNYKGSFMEQLADKGNGNYAYIDTLLEAKKVLVNQLSGTLITIAKDVKIQIEFNPTYVQEYRLIGYFNRKLKAKDFEDDTKDAGEIGAGHTVTALYEIVPVGVKSMTTGEIDLRYQDPKTVSENAVSNEVLFVKLRYKPPKEDESILLEQPLSSDQEIVKVEDTSNNFRFSASVAAFAMMLRNSEYSGDADLDMIYNLGKEATGKDEYGYRVEFLSLVKKSDILF